MAFCALPVLTKTDLSRHLSVSKSYLSSIILAPFFWLIQTKPDLGAQSTIHSAVEPSINIEELFYL